MSQPEISPLARRLAEENNVDWRGLHGSGAGGKVVERDVLEYLARVMAGEEDLDPTPEPVPEGMEGWPEQDVRAFQHEIRASERNVGLDEIQRELSAADRQGDGAELDLPDAEDAGGERRAGEPLAGEQLGGEQLGGASPTYGDRTSEKRVSEDRASEDLAPEGLDREGLDREGLDRADLAPEGLLPEAGAFDPDAAPLDADAAEAISEDIFLFDDDEDEVVSGSAGFAGPAEPRAPAGTDPDEELLVAGEEGAAGDPSAWDEPAQAGAEAWTGDEGASRQDAASEPDGLPDLFGAPPAAEEEGVASGEALFEGSSATAEDSGEPELEVPPLGDLGLDEGARPEGAGIDEGAMAAPEAADEARWGETVEQEASWEVDEAQEASWEVDEAQEAVEPFEAPTSELFEAPASEPFEAGVTPEPAPTDPGAEPWQADATPFAADAPGSPAATGDAAEQGWNEAPVHGAEAGAAASGSLPVVSFGTLLRRHVDVTALAGAQLAVALELGGGEPLSPAAFLLRAAAKAAAGGAWSPGAIAMVGWDDEGRLRYRAFPQAASDPFPELVRRLSTDPDTAEDALGDAALAVADMSALDVDEAVLAVDAPLLTLGRILYDNQRGSYRSTLSLAGDVSPERGGRLLARVAELLDAPVRLVL